LLLRGRINVKGFLLKAGQIVAIHIGIIDISLDFGMAFDSSQPITIPWANEA
jgi:hypothetical protein